MSTTPSARTITPDPEPPGREMLTTAGETCRAMRTTFCSSAPNASARRGTPGRVADRGSPPRLRCRCRACPQDGTRRRSRGWSRGHAAHYFRDRLRPYALKAFDLAAVDYLVKPFDDERFEQAFRRARRMVELEEVGRLSEQLRAVLQGGRQTAARQTAERPGQGYLERIAVEMRGQVRVVPVKQIEYITASGPYAELHTSERRYIIRERMQTLEERLDPAWFFRIHRSAIVRLDLIETLLRNPGGDYAVQLKGGPRLKVSRSRIEELEQRIGL